MLVDIHGKHGATTQSHDVIYFVTIKTTKGYFSAEESVIVFVRYLNTWFQLSVFFWLSVQVFKNIVPTRPDNRRSTVLTNEKSTRIIVLCNTKTIAIIKKLIEESSIKKQQLTIMMQKSKKQFTQYDRLHESQIYQNESNFWNVLHINSL